MLGTILLRSGLSHSWRQAIMNKCWLIVHMTLCNLNEITMILFPKIHCKASFAKCRLFCSGPIWRNPSSDISLLWRHKGRDDVSIHQPHDCLLNRSFRRRSKKTSKLRVTGLCVREIHRRPMNSPHKGPVTRKMFQFDDVIMCLRTTPPCGILCASVRRLLTH